MTRLSRASIFGVATVTLAATLSALSPVVASATPVTAATLHTASSTDVFGSGPYIVPDSQAAQAASSLASTNAAEAAAAATIAKYPVATWLGEWYQGSALTSVLTTQVTASEANGTTPVFVVYGIPDRDCGGYSAGGFTNATYNTWTDQIASTLAGKRVAVIVEPDSLAQLSGACSNVTADREALLLHEMKAFGAAGVPAYLDAGNSNWIAPSVMAQRLTAAGIAYGRGFSSNVSNYYPSANEIAYDNQVSALTGGAHYVIDTSRSGKGSDGEWCNAAGAGLGQAPRVVSNGTALDALLWIKTPGASDGTCNGGPDAGTWFPSYAQTLVANAELDASTVVTSPVTGSGGSSSTGGTSTGSTGSTTVGSITKTALAGPVTVTAGATVHSPSGQYSLNVQSDGNLVVYGNGRALWSSKTSGHAGAHLVMQSDGNAVLYSTAGKALWASGTSSVKAATTLAISDTGNLTVARGSKVYWQNKAPGSNTLTATVALATGQKIVDSTTRELVMQSDGNLVLYKNGKAAWSSKTSRYPGATVHLQSDGNLVIYDASGKARWASGTSRYGAKGLKLTLQSDGNLVFYKNGKAVWASHTAH